MAAELMHESDVGVGCLAGTAFCAVCVVFALGLYQGISLPALSEFEMYRWAPDQPCGVPVEHLPDGIYMRLAYHFGPGGKNRGHGRVIEPRHFLHA